MRFLAAASALLAMASPLSAQRAIGDWHGDLVIDGKTLRIGMSFAKSRDGALWGTALSPDEGPWRTVFDPVIWAGRTLYFESPPATFTATWDAARQGWAGVWNEGKPTPLFLLPGSLPSSSQSMADRRLARFGDTSHAARLADGRSINMVCLGHGKPTVLFNAGSGDWGATWGAVQSAIARRTRTCTWDRAGFGFSSASIAPQTIVETTKDLEMALRANKIEGPFIIVAHSLGGLEALLFADHHKSAVVGMVLVDPTFPDTIARLHKAAPSLAAADDKAVDASVAYRRDCTDAIEKKPLEAPSCTSYRADLPSSVIFRLSRLDRDPARLRTTVSHFENGRKNQTLAIDPSRNYGTMPLIVLTADKSQLRGQDASLATRLAFGQQQAEWQKGHVELANLSRQGQHRVVSDSGHFIQTEHPEAVIAAANEVLNESRASKHY
jgi:pimeloyl-ACP methyl ester carboxylesterase